MRTVGSSGFASAIFSLVVQVQASPIQVEEAEFLLQRLASTNCEFMRNGEWHDGRTASRHLGMKYRAMRSMRPSMTTEDFIGLGGSSSSATGQPYKVRCPGHPEMPAADWLRGQLKARD